jgi:hypothetical protein
MMMYVAVILWCSTLIRAAAVTSSRHLPTEQASSHHRITKDGYKKPRLPVPVIFDTDYGPFIDDGMFFPYFHSPNLIFDMFTTTLANV